ncbi:MAG: hypothetical protein ABIH35_01085 [Patescibacteria group bacterium]
MFHSFKNCCENLKFEMKNRGEKLEITFSGKKADIAKFEEKLKALKTLCCDGGCCV